MLAMDVYFDRSADIKPLIRDHRENDTGFSDDTLERRMAMQARALEAAFYHLMRRAAKCDGEKNFKDAFTAHRLFMDSLKIMRERKSGRKEMR